MGHVNRLMEYKPLTTDALKLSLISGPVEPERYFHVMKQAELQGSPGIRAYVIGSSHVAVFGDDPCMTEILACSEVPQENPSLRCRLFEEQGQNRVQLDLGSFRYRCDIETVSFGSEVIDRMRDQAKSFAENGKIGLSAKFPCRNGLAPLTVVCAEVLPDGGGRVRTLHSYPEENRVVITDSSVEWAQPKKDMLYGQ